MLKKQKAGPPGEKNNGGNVLNIIGIVLCILLVPILIVNCVLLIQSAIHEDQVPSIGGNIPLIVLTESMDPEIRSGDMIVCKVIDASEVKVGDVISYFDPEGNGTSVVTHRVLQIETDPSTGERLFRTKGDNNNLEDRLAVPASNLVGIWEGTRIGHLGSVIMFMQSTLGLVICVLLPVAAIVIYEVIRRKKQDNAKQSDIDTLRAELEALKAAQQGNASEAEAPSEAPAPEAPAEEPAPQDPPTEE
ncbi:MAG: signal peptidase I [Clostridia bacterium]|nr:signal peptidase I [Clostridia bacterium]